MRKLLIALCASSAFAGSGWSADLRYKAPPPPAPVSYWTGFYIGANAGWIGSSGNTITNTGADTDGGGPGFALSQGFIPGSISLSHSGFIGGGQIGYNWQGVWHPHLVLGVEADIQGGDISDKATWNPFANSTTAVSESRLDWFGTVRGRLGYASGGTLVYGTGGFAYGHIHNSQADNRPGGPVVFNIDTTATGFTVGGGVEYKLTPAWSVKAEYQFIDLGKNDPFSPQPGQGLFTSFKTTLEDDAFHTVRAGLNYHFGSGYMPLK